MYLAIVLLTMLVLPVGSMAVEHLAFHAGAPLILLAGKWFVFWGVGVRLFLAGLRQFLQPTFTAREIFGIDNDDVLPLVRELGVANFASGVVGLLSIVRPDFTLPAAIAAGIFYGVAGVRHVAVAHKSRNETIAMVSDLFIAAILAAFVAAVVLG